MVVSGAAYGSKFGMVQWDAFFPALNRTPTLTFLKLRHASLASDLPSEVEGETKFLDGELCLLSIAHDWNPIAILHLSIAYMYHLNIHLNNLGKKIIPLPTGSQ